MRALKIAAWLVAVTAACMVGLVAAGVVGAERSLVGAAEIVGGWLVLIVIALIVAAVASIGPKSRATPVLTPVVAGTIASVVIVMLVYVGRLAASP